MCPALGSVVSDATTTSLRRSWRSTSAVQYDTLEWLDWYNNRRLFEPIGNIPPTEAEAA
jgi:putative transposase